MLGQVIHHAVASNVALDDLKVTTERSLALRCEERESVLAIEHHELAERDRAGSSGVLQFRHPSRQFPRLLLRQLPIGVT
jgi:hypothetical protein